MPQLCTRLGGLAKRLCVKRTSARQQVSERAMICPHTTHTCSWWASAATELINSVPRVLEDAGVASLSGGRSQGVRSASSLPISFTLCCVCVEQCERRECQCIAPISNSVTSLQMEWHPWFEYMQPQQRWQRGLKCVSSSTTNTKALRKTSSFQAYILQNHLPMRSRPSLVVGMP